MESIWSKNTEIMERAPLPGNIEADTAVIGGGMAGILTAYYLKKQGVEAVVLEADRIGSGQTRNTTAKITSQHNLIYDKMLRTFGAEQAHHYAAINEWAVSEYERIVKEKEIDCDFTRCPSFLYSCTETDVLKREAQAAGLLGIQSEFVETCELPFSIAGAVRFDNQARFQPLEFLKMIAGEVEIYEKTRVMKVEGNQVMTGRGTVSAKSVVFACHFPFINVPGYYFARMHQERSYVAALEQAELFDGIYLGIDEDGLSFRNQGELLLIGGGSHQTGRNREGGKYEMLKQRAKELWPECKVTAQWSAQDCMTLDGIPYVGRFAESRPDWYVATGFGKWGMTNSMVSARILSDMITGKTCLAADIYSPQRHATAKAAKTLLENGTAAAGGLTRRVFAGGRADAVKLPEGHGGIVELDGEKVGAYKKGGRLYVVPVRCPHLGCQLEWNPDELSWDCPCHGSRFDYEGRLLNNPAQEDLK